MSEISTSQIPVKCQNCQYDLRADMDYCPTCGQRVLPEHLTTSYFLKEFLNNYFSFDSRFFKTLKPLLLKPGWLTIEFLSGKRIRYINPVQVFIFASFLYFLVDSLIFVESPGEKDLIVFSENGQAIGTDTLNDAQIDSLFRGDNDASTSTWSWTHFLQKAHQFNQLDKATQNEKISKILSYAIFFLTPIFAIYLGWFFRKRNRHYLENLIFSLHFHSFYFVLATIFLFINRIFPDDMVKFASFILVCFYLTKALRTFFPFSWKSILFRFSGLLVLYGFTVIIFFIGSVLLSVVLF